MPEYPDETNADAIYYDGAEPVQVKLTADEAEKYFGAGSPAGWYPMSLTEESGWEDDFDFEAVKDERNVVVRRKKKKADGKISAKLLETGGRQYAMAKDLREKEHLYRVFYPQAGTDALLVGLRNATVMSPRKGEGKAEARRTLDTEIMGSKTRDGKDGIEVCVVDRADETAWPAEADDFKTDAAAA